MADWLLFTAIGTLLVAVILAMYMQITGNERRSTTIAVALMLLIGGGSLIAAFQVDCRLSKDCPL